MILPPSYYLNSVLWKWGENQGENSSIKRGYINRPKSSDETLHLFKTPSAVFHRLCQQNQF